MPDINPMEENLDFVTPEGNGLRVKLNGQTPKILTSNAETSSLIDSTNYYTGTYTPAIGTTVEGVENISISECTYQVIDGKQVRVQGLITFDLTLLLNPFITFSIPVESDISANYSVSGFANGSGTFGSFNTLQTGPSTYEASITVYPTTTFTGRTFQFEFFYQIIE